MAGQINDSVGVSPFVIIPGDQFVEFVVQSNTSLSVKNRRSALMNEVSRSNFVFSISQISLKIIKKKTIVYFQFSFRSFFDFFAQVVVANSVFKGNRQINNRNVNSGDSESHSSQLSVQFRNDQSYGFGSSSSAGNNVDSTGSSGSPIFSTRSSSINSDSKNFFIKKKILLVSSSSMNSGHQSINNSVVFVDN